mmetsp:Transcript_23418/g.66793  ORF Transcript_23418/g.66793 Transcript_23418/m.66793 type:complete len:254 (-) Transcript_23418:541-1302(-)
MSLLTRPASEAQSCATDRGSTFGSPLKVMAPSMICMKGFCESAPQSSSSWMCEVHMSNAMWGSWIGSTVRGGPGTSSFLLMDGSKHVRPSGGRGCALWSSLSTRPRQLVSLRCASSSAFLALPFLALPPLSFSRASSRTSASKADMYSPMNSSLHATASAAGEAEPLRPFTSLSILRITSAGSEEKTLASKSTPNMLGMKSSSSKTPACRTALRARRQAARKASTKAPKSGIGLRCFFTSCKYKQQKHVWTMV